MNKIEAGIEQNSLGVEGNASELATARATVAPNFLTTKAYAVGDYVYYNDALYRFTSAHAAGAWVGTDATQVVMGNDLTDLKGDISYNYIRYTTGTNLFDVNNTANICNGYYFVSSSGAKRESSSMSAFIVPIDASKGALSINSTWVHIAFLSAYADINSVNVGDVVSGYISGVSGSSSACENVSIPSNATYVIVSMSTSQLPTAQLQYGSACTTYEAYEKVIDGQEIKEGSISLDAIVKTTYTVDINGGGDYTSILEALKNTPDNTRIHVRQGTYNIIDEYKAFYGSTFWDNYDSYNNHSDDNFYRGYWISDGRIIDCDANALFTFDYTGTNTNVKSYFSPFALGKNATLKGVNIQFTNTCRYAVHDDFAGYIAGTPEGINTIENCVFDGAGTAIGGGCGRSNTYVINNCIFLNGLSNTNAFYHNNANAGAKNKLFISNCYGNKGLEFRWYGESTKISECMASSCQFSHISCVANSSGVTTNENMVLYKINCTETES
jgi:hypothetical protein